MSRPPKDAFLNVGKESEIHAATLVIPSRLQLEDFSICDDLCDSQKISFLVDEDAVLDSELAEWLDKQEDAVFRYRQATTTVESLKEQMRKRTKGGGVILFVPGEARTVQNPLTTIPSETLAYLIEAADSVQALYIEKPSDFCPAVFAHECRSTPIFALGEKLQGESLTLATYQERLMEAGELAFRHRPYLKVSLPVAVLRGLKKFGKNAVIYDGMTKTELGHDKLLAASIVLSRVLRKRTKKQRVAILLPPGAGSFVANVATLFAGKVPVNLNFTASKDAMASAIRQAEVDLFVTADRFRKKMTRLEWPSDEQTLLLDQELPKLKLKIGLCLAATKILPSRAIARMLKLSAEGGAREAVLLFTSGSSGEPKGVALTHENIVANVNQFGGRLNLAQTDRMLACLPPFHSFGCTVTQWYTLIYGISTVTYPSPLDSAQLAELIDTQGVTLLLATPTFLRGYMRKATPEQLSGLKLVVTGAEKLPARTAEAFEKKFGHPVLEGYGLTETSPVTNVNLPNLPSEGKVPSLPSHRPGSVGQLMPGIAARIMDPETDELLSLHETGMLWLRAPNVFEGYLNDREKTAEVIKNGWFKTGDLGRFDADGFLFIEGRLSRFSKIGGEMVPHETVEDHVQVALGIDPGEERQIVIVGVPDDQKGEALVLISAVKNCNFDELRKKLLAEGVPSLWIPKKSLSVEAIPTMASGKLDLRACQDLARDELGAALSP